MCEIENAITYTRRGPIRKNFAQRGGNQCIGLVAGDLQRHTGCAQHIDVAFERCGIEDRLPAYFLPLVQRLVRPQAIGTPLARSQSCVLWRGYRCTAIPFPTKPPGRKSEPQRFSAVARPCLLSYPATRFHLIVGIWPRGLFDPRAQHGAVHHSGVLALQPMIPPTQAFLQEADLRTGLCEMRILVSPWANQSLARPFQIVQQPSNRVGISI